MPPLHASLGSDLNRQAGCHCFLSAPAGLPHPSVPVPRDDFRLFCAPVPAPAALLMLQLFPKLAALHLESVMGALYDLLRLPGPDPAALPAGLVGVAADLRIAQVRRVRREGFRM